VTTPSGSSRAASSALAIKVRELSVVLGSSLILDDVSLAVGGGESVAILGANGSGKSTLVKAVLGLVPLSGGSIEVLGTPTTRRHRVPWQRIGYVPQRIGAGSGVPATALEVVRSGLLGPRRPWADRGRSAKCKAMAALDAVGLAHRAADHVQVFSGGQASLSFGGFARIEEPSATYTVNGTPTIAVALTCNGGGSAAFPSLAFYDEELNLIASYDLSKISDAESYEPVVTSLEPQGDTLHVEWSNERLPTDTRGIHSGSGTGSADLSWNGSSFDKSNVTVHDAQGNQVSS